MSTMTIFSWNSGVWKALKAITPGICGGPSKCSQICKEYFVGWKVLVILSLLMKCTDTQPVEEGDISLEACHLFLSSTFKLR